MPFINIMNPKKYANGTIQRSPRNANVESASSAATAKIKPPSQSSNLKVGNGRKGKPASDGLNGRIINGEEIRERFVRHMDGEAQRERHPGCSEPAGRIHFY